MTVIFLRDFKLVKYLPNEKIKRKEIDKMYL